MPTAARVASFRRVQVAGISERARHLRTIPQGVIAKGEDMREAFGTDDHMKVALIILEKGELEVSGA